MNESQKDVLYKIGYGVITFATIVIAVLSLIFLINSLVAIFSS
ncbi:MAG: hypothetical protein ACFE8E_10315 [Candidatus Hodarchaeota archaeon]